jgi:hypothetical protein
MKKFTTTIQNLEEKLEAIKSNNQNAFCQFESSIIACNEALNILRQLVVTKGFKDPEQECAFFKTIKPKVTAYLYYYLNLANIEKAGPFPSQKEEKKFLIFQVQLLKEYFSEHPEFYDYYMLGRVDMDKEFFLRNIKFVKFHYDAISNITDSQFATSYDLVLAKILGNTKTIEHLQKKIESNQEENSSNPNPENPATLKWTGTKVDMVELIYALHASGVINNGQASLTDLAKAFETLFQKDTGDFYRTFLEIRTRKSNQSKFLDTLKTSLLQRIIQIEA